MPLPRLITISFSHYCEKARWALQRADVAFTEEGHLPAFHIAPVKRAGGRRSTPTLVTEGGVLSDSTDILEWADRRAPPGRGLYGDSDEERREIEALEELCDEDLGPHTRRFLYFHILPRRDVMARVAQQPVPAWERTAFVWGLPAIRALMRKAMRIDQDGAERSRAKVDEVFAKIAERVADGRRFLVGARPSAADLAFASLAAPVLLPPRYGAPLPPLEVLPSEAAEPIRRWSEHPAGQWALRFYEEHRAG